MLFFLQLQCCGGQGFTDYQGSQWSKDDPLYVEERKDKAPLTCCRDYKRYEDIMAAEYRYSLVVLSTSFDGILAAMSTDNLHCQHISCYVHILAAMSTDNLLWPHTNCHVHI